ncbi:MAG: NAD-dependent epimerase/dehydratase family protein [Steroidobacteraceae bacterium]
MSGRQVIVTGGLGFIGSALCERLLRGGETVTIVDSMVSNVVTPAHFTSRFPQARVHVTTVADFFAKPPALSREDLVFHAASLVGPAGILAYAGTIGADLVQSTSGVVNACVQSGAALVYMSSAEIYGRSGVLDETADARVPARYNARIEYALGKLTCESMIANSRQRGLRATIIRPFNVVGPRQNRAGGFVMPTFVQQALAGEAITVFGSGQQQRAFTDVEDVVTFLCTHAVAALGGAELVFNVGNPHNSISIIDLARRMVRLLNSRSEILFTSGDKVHGPLYFEAESFEKLPDITRALQVGWSPTRFLDDVILDTAKFYRAGGGPGQGTDVRDYAA